MGGSVATYEIRPFVADMPGPIDDESLLGFVSRALRQTLIVKLRHGLALADVRLAGSPSGVNIAEEQAAGLATLFKVDREQIVRRLHPKTAFDHIVGRGGEAVDFFGTKIRTQYLETMFRRVSPRALAVAPYHRALWDLRPFNFDPQTREMLLKSCPVCGEKLRWVFVRGPTHCDHCVTERGLRKTDLREHPQPVFEFEDEEAIDFVVGLVHPEAQRREAVRKSLPPGLAEASNSDVFEAVVTIASCFRPENVTKMFSVGRPLRAGDFDGLTPDLLEIAGRMVIGGANGFAAGTARLRAHMADRKKTHGMFAEIGPLAGTINDKSLAPVVREFLVESLQQDLLDTSELGLIRRRLGAVMTKSSGAWINLQEAFELFGVSKHALQRLVATGLVEVRRTDLDSSPVLMNREEIAPLAALYKDAMDENRAKAALRVSTAELNELADRGLLQRIADPVKSMLGSKSNTVYRASSVKGVMIAIKKRAGAPNPSRRTKDHLWNEARRLPSPLPWPAIIELLLSGDIKIERHREDKDWRKCVALADFDAFETIVRAEQAKGPAVQSTWLSRGQAAEALNIAESSVRKVAEAGFLSSKRDGARTMYKRSDVAETARKYVFLPEMVERSPLNVAHEVSRWMKSVGIEPLLERGKSIFPIYDRASFERALPSMPAALNQIELPERANARVPAAVKREAVKQVESGLSAHFVARRLGVSNTAVQEWVAYFIENGDVPPASKLEGREDYVRSAIEADPSRSTHSLWQSFKKSGLDVGYTITAKFIAELGYQRDAAGHLALKD
ncbi:transposase [Bradyrhizobium iriomotense]|uniref:transposase n=1 Tax=Bradyrhizobium iriomotense TaxID=441950 RepID=UPI001B8A59A3|nr:transposase [Bradyrhizobium iriomotense]MBR0780757.1 transposase [Bradyrhizobium iriomotense]